MVMFKVNKTNRGNVAALRGNNARRAKPSQSSN
jgi:hypothetical protein